MLEGAQAGLSWSTILNKRDRYREVFAGFDPARAAKFDEATIDDLLTDPGIVRNRAKVEATVANARATVALQEGGEPRDPAVVLRRRPAGTQPVVHHGRDPGVDTSLGCDESRPPGARIPLRRPDDLLRPHAGQRAWSTTTWWTASGG